MKLFVEVVEDSTGESDVFTANVARLSSDDPKDNLFGKVGNKLKFDFNVLKIGSDIILRVENNETNLITVSYLRITF